MLIQEAAVFTAATGPKALIDIYHHLLPPSILNFPLPQSALLLVYVSSLVGVMQTLIPEWAKPVATLLLSGHGC